MNLLIAGVSLFVNGFGVYLTMHASIGAAPWDVFNLGLSKTLGIIYGTASISVSVLVIVIDILLKEPIGLAMLLDAVVVGKSVDFFNWLDIVPVPETLVGLLDHEVRCHRYPAPEHPGVGEDDDKKKRETVEIFGILSISC